MNSQQQSQPQVDGRAETRDGAAASERDEPARPMRITILGATGSVGRELVTQALDAGREVTALVRKTPKPGDIDPRVSVVEGDATDPAPVSRAIAGSDAVLSALGHVKGSPDAVLTDAISNVIPTMRAQGIERLIVLVPPSIGDAGDRPNLWYRLLRGLLPIMMRSVTRDQRAQARLIEASGLAWTIVRGAPFLTDGPHTGRYQAGPMTRDAGLRISRADLADFMLAAATTGQFVGGRPLVTQPARVEGRDKEDTDAHGITRSV